MEENIKKQLNYKRKVVQAQSQNKRYKIFYTALVKTPPFLYSDLVTGTGFGNA